MVTAYNASGDSAYQNAVNATPTATTPLVPTGVSAVPGNAQVSLSWTSVSGATSYNVKRSLTSGSGYAIIASGITTANYSDTGLTNGTTYYYVVSAVNASGESPNSSQVSATPTMLPGTPTGLSALGGNAQVSLTWTAATGAATYNLYRATTTGGEGTTAYKTGITGTGYTDTALINGTAYYYTLAAANASGTSGQSAEASATPYAAVPSAPTNLNVGGGVQQESLTWNAVAGAASYNVKRAAQSGGPYQAIGTATSSSYVDKPLTAGIYYYVVTAVTAAGESPNSNEDYDTVTNPPGPNAPAGLTATAISSTQINLSWGTVAGTASYNLKRATVSGGPYVTVASPTAAAFSDTGLSTGTTYYYVVTAVSSGGESVNSNQASATPQFPIPSVPGSLTATAGNTQVTLGWAASAGATSYNLYRSTSSGGEGSTAYRTGLTALSFSDTGLTNGTTYFYQVTAVNSRGESANSSEASATPQLPPPTSPTSLRASAVGLTEIDLDWDFSSGVTGYKIERSPDGSTGWVQVGTKVYDVYRPIYRDTGLSGGTTYYYRVRASNPSGDSDYSNIVSASLLPPQPTGLNATGGNAQVSLAWTGSGTATGYNVYRTLNPTGAFTKVNTAAVTGLAYTDTGLSNGTAYFYYVTAVNATGEGGGSNTASATPQISVPLPPTNLAASVASASQINLSWNASTGATSYNLYRSTTSGGEGNQPFYSGLSYTSRADTLVSGLTTYYYQVTAVNAGGESSKSSEIAITMPLVPIQFRSDTTNPVNGGSTAWGWVYLNAFAPTGGAVVNLSSNNPAAAVPSTVTVAAGNNGISFPITTTLVPTTTDATLTASCNGVSLSYTLTILSDLILSANASTLNVKPGGSSSSTIAITSSTGAATGDVTLSMAGVPAGVTAWLSSSSTTFPSNKRYSNSSTLYLCVGNGVATGTYLITIMGTCGIYSNSATVTLNVQ